MARQEREFLRELSQTELHVGTWEAYMGACGGRRGIGARACGGVPWVAACVPSWHAGCRGHGFRRTCRGAPVITERNVQQLQEDTCVGDVVEGEEQGLWSLALRA